MGDALKLKNALLIKKLDEMKGSMKNIKAENKALKVENKAVNKKLEESRNRMRRSYECLKILETECDARKAMNEEQKKMMSQLLELKTKQMCKKLESENVALRKEAYENDKELNEKLKKAKEKEFESQAIIAALNMDNNILAAALEEVILQKNESKENVDCLEKKNDEILQTQSKQQIIPTVCANAMALFWMFYIAIIGLWTFEMDKLEKNETIFYEEEREKVFDKTSSAKNSKQAVLWQSHQTKR